MTMLPNVSALSVNYEVAASCKEKTPMTRKQVKSMIKFGNVVFNLGDGLGRVDVSPSVFRSDFHKSKKRYDVNSKT